jgi:hypothetical protein
MNIWLVGSGIPRRTSCANYAAPLKRLLAEAELEKDALREVAKGKF